MINPMQLIQMAQQLQGNPIQFLAQRGIQIPTNIANNPQEIIQQMLNSGRITQQQYEQARQMAAQFKR